MTCIYQVEFCYICGNEYVWCVYRHYMITEHYTEALNDGRRCVQYDDGHNDLQFVGDFERDNWE
jgi:hypothetical protein